MKHPFRRHALFLLCGILLYLVLAGSLNSWVDPWRALDLPWRSAALEPYRDCDRERRVGKAGLAVQNRWKHAIIGSSRFEIGLDPRQWPQPSGECVNLGLSGATLLENVAVGRYLLSHNPGLESMIFGIDLGDLHGAGDSRKNRAFQISAFARGSYSIDEHLGHLFGSRSLAESFAALNRYRQGKPPVIGACGEFTRDESKPDLRTYVERAFNADYEVQWPRHPLVADKRKIAALRGFISECQSRGITLHLVIPPQHALKQIHPLRDRPDQLAFEADLTALREVCAAARAAAGPPVHLWSFARFNEVTEEAIPPAGHPEQKMKYWFDLGHANLVAGARVYQTIFPPDTAGPLGCDLLAVSWDDYRREWLAAHEAYCRHHADDVAWWRGLVRELFQAQHGKGGSAEPE